MQTSNGAVRVGDENFLQLNIDGEKAPYEVEVLGFRVIDDESAGTS